MSALITIGSSAVTHRVGQVKVAAESESGDCRKCFVSAAALKQS